MSATNARERYRLSSNFAGRLSGYIAYRRKLGYKATRDEENHAPEIDRFCLRRFPDKEALDAELSRAWVRAGSTASTRASRAGFIRGFARYLIEEEGEDAYVLPRSASPSMPPPEMPHIFTQPELDAFFDAADTMKPSGQTKARHLVAPVAFRLLLCCGLRPGEVRRLRVCDVDLVAGVIHVIDSKNSRDRDVPMHEDVRALCEAYSKAVEEVFPKREWFFPGSTGGVWSRISLLDCFHKCWRDAGVTEFSGPRPVPYSFRHTFATRTICRWREEGVDVDANLRFLQEYMGHANIKGTLYYLHFVRGGLGDSTSVPTWSPSDRMKEEGGWFYVEA